jgi:hypothetical protein
MQVKAHVKDMTAARSPNPQAKFEAEAQRWDLAGRPESQLPAGLDLVALRCWLHSDGGKRDGASPLLKEYASSARSVQPDNWLDDYLDVREHCNSCGESYRFENIALCPNCHGVRCYRCASSTLTASNGNSSCECGGEYVG